MAALTPEEKKWVAKLQKVLKECPESLRSRAGSYTIGDSDIVIFDKRKYQYTGSDVGVDVAKSDADLARVYMPFAVWSTAG